MAGHSHSSNIKHKKALLDNKRGKVWGKCSKAIMVAARISGGDPDGNPRLRLAIDDARAANMPKDTIERAIKKGTGELADAQQIEEVLYEGYGPGGVAVLAEIMTDNRNRTAPEIRKIFDVHDGKLAGANAVAWMFDRKGIFVIPSGQVSEDRMTEIALEAGADDVKTVGDRFELTCDPVQWANVSAALTAAGLTPEISRISRIPKNTVDLEPDQARKALKLVEALDNHDDVQSVASNFNVPDEVLAEQE
jgi:YebC/PmpR family DNA-binding regulatory protein